MASLDTLSLFLGSYAATLGIAAACSYLGVFTILRRIVFTGVALAQLAAAGVATAFWLADRPGLPPGLRGLVVQHGATVGSLAAALLGALGLQARPSWKRLTPDALVGLVYAGASALAILLVWRSSVGLAELRNILAGEVLLSRQGELVGLGVGLALVGLVHVALRRRFVLVSFDPEFARALGLPEARLQLLFLVTLAVAVALSLRAGGLLLVFSFLVLPPAAGLVLGRGLGESQALAVAAALGSTLAGFAAAISLDLPVAPSVALAQLALLALALAGRTWPAAATPARAALVLAGALALAAVPAAWARPGAGPGAREPGPGRGEAPAFEGPGAARAGDPASRGDAGPTRPASDGHEGAGHAGVPGEAHPGDDLAGDLEGARLDLVAAPEPEARRRALVRLGEEGAPEDLDLVLLGLGDDDPLVQDAAVEAVRRLLERGEGRARLALLARGEAPPGPGGGATGEVRALAALALHGLGDPAAYDAFVEVLADGRAPLLLVERVHAHLARLRGGVGLAGEGADDLAGDRAAVAARWAAWWAGARGHLRWDPDSRAFSLAPE